MINLWNKNISEFSDDFFRRDTRRIFDIFRTKGILDLRTSLGLKTSAGIQINKNFYFGHSLADAFTTPLTNFNAQKFDSWLNNNILVRGERLTCQRCGLSEFYNENDYGGSFTCKRCNSVWKRNLKTMGAAEPRFLYGLNPLIYGLFDSDSDLTIFAMDCLKKKSKRYFEAETEIEIVDNNTGKAIMEVDLVANTDSKLAIGECKINGQLVGQQLQSYIDFTQKIRANFFCSASKESWNQQRIDSIKKAFSTAENRIPIEFFSP